MPNRLKISIFANGRAAVVEAWRAMQKFAVVIARQAHGVASDAVGGEQFYALFPHVVGFAHGDPYVR